MSTRPYPFERWHKLTRTQLHALASLRALYDERGTAEALRSASVLLGAPVVVQAGAPESQTASAIAAQLATRGAAVGVLLECAAGPLDGWLLAEVSSAFAERLVDRTLGGDGTLELTPTLLPLDELSRGALAYLVARVLAVLSGALCLRDITGQLSELFAPLADCALVVYPIAVRVGNELGNLRLYLPEALAGMPRAQPIRNALPALPLTLIAELGNATLDGRELLELGRGDTLLLDRSNLTFDGARFMGHVQVHVAGSRSHLVCRALERGLEVESVVREMERSMTTGRLSQPPATTADGPNLAADAPLEVSIELARFSITLGELQRTQPGDVLVTGRRIGDAVTLRVAGRAIAQGELVDVEGEIGVRITRFADGTD